MTSIVIWLNKESGKDVVWAVSDSRLSGDNESPMTNECPKLYSIPIKVYANPQKNYQFQIASIGFCFAGSSLIGMSSLIKLQNDLGCLDSGKPDRLNPELALKKLPSIQQISEHLKKIVQSYVSEILTYKFSIKSNSALRCEVSIFGWCQIDSTFKCYRIGNSENDQRTILVKENNLYKNNWIILGCDKSDVELAIEEERKKLTLGSIEWHRAPIRVVMDIANNETYKTIGGSLQIARSYNPFTDLVFPVTLDKLRLSSLGEYIVHPHMMNIDTI